jgi:hypothetical protein
MSVNVQGFIYLKSHTGLQAKTRNFKEEEN